MVVGCVDAPSFVTVVGAAVAVTSTTEAGVDIGVSSSGIKAGTAVVPRRPVRGARDGDVAPPSSFVSPVGAAVLTSGDELKSIGMTGALVAGMLEGLLDRLLHLIASADIGPSSVVIESGRPTDVSGAEVLAGRFLFKAYATAVRSSYLVTDYPPSL